MSKLQHIYDRFLSFLGRGLLSLWWGSIRRQGWQRKWWAEMDLTDGHGRIRNKPCPCRSGLKFKRCHGATRQQKSFWKQQQEERRDMIRIRNTTHPQTGLRA